MCTVGADDMLGAVGWRAVEARCYDVSGPCLDLMTEAERTTVVVVVLAVSGMPAVAGEVVFVEVEVEDVVEVSQLSDGEHAQVQRPQVEVYLQSLVQTAWYSLEFVLLTVRKSRTSVGSIATKNPVCVLQIACSIRTYVLWTVMVLILVVVSLQETYVRPSDETASAAVMVDSAQRVDVGPEGDRNSMPHVGTSLQEAKACRYTEPLGEVVTRSRPHPPVLTMQTVRHDPMVLAVESDIPSFHSAASLPLRTKLAESDSSYAVPRPCIRHSFSQTRHAAQLALVACFLSQGR